MGGGRKRRPGGARGEGKGTASASARGMCHHPRGWVPPPEGLGVQMQGRRAWRQPCGGHPSRQPPALPPPLRLRSARPAPVGQAAAAAGQQPSGGTSPSPRRRRPAGKFGDVPPNFGRCTFCVEAGSEAGRFQRDFVTGPMCVNVAPVRPTDYVDARAPADVVLPPHSDAVPLRPLARGGRFDRPWGH